MRCIINEQQQEEFFMSNLINGSARLNKTYRLTMLALWTAIILILTLTPLGYPKIFLINMTIIQVPVIIGAIIGGPIDGAILGLIFGISSVFKATIQPDPTSSFFFSPFVPMGNFTSLIIAIAPRVLVGLFAAYIFILISKFDKTKVFACAGAGIAGALTNSIFVLGGIFIFFGGVIAKTSLAAFYLILGVFVSNSIAEVALSALLVSAIAGALLVVTKNEKIA
jgi:uncharacterized membrane protein